MNKQLPCRAASAQIEVRQKATGISRTAGKVFTGKVAIEF